MNSRRNLFLAFFWLLIILFALAASESSDVNNDSTVCEKMLEDIASPSETERSPDYKMIKEQILLLAGKCSGTGIYEAQLGRVYNNVGDYEEAFRLLTPLARPDKSPYYPQVMIQFLLAKFGVWANNGELTAKQNNEIEQGFLNVVAQYPRWSKGYEQTANFMLYEKKYSQAIEYANQAISLDADSWLSNRTLTVAYEAVGQYLLSANAANRTEELRPSITSEPLFMCAFARSLVKIRHVDDAEMILKILVHHRPDFQQTQEFASTASLVLSEKAAAH